MGIKNLNKLVKRLAPGAVRDTFRISMLRSRKVAVDTNLYLYKYKVALGDNWLDGFINLVNCFRRRGAHLVFVMDNKYPVEKLNEQQKRREQRQKGVDKLEELRSALDAFRADGLVAGCIDPFVNKPVNAAQNMLLFSSVRRYSTQVAEKNIQDHIDLLESRNISIEPEDFAKLEEMLFLMEIPCMKGLWEADTTCSLLCLQARVDAVLSDDTDIMAYGTPLHLSKLETGSGTCTAVIMEELLEESCLTRAQFLDLCIMCGTDYNTNIPGVGPVTAVKLLTQHGSIDDLPDKYNPAVLNHTRVRQMFGPNGEEFEVVPFCGIPQFQALGEFFDRQYGDRMWRLSAVERAFANINTIVFEEEI